MLASMKLVERKAVKTFFLTQHYTMGCGALAADRGK
jgi:hypothetical protein